MFQWYTTYFHVVCACAHEILLQRKMYNIIVCTYIIHDGVLVEQKRCRKINMVNGHLVRVILSDCSRQYRRDCPFSITYYIIIVGLDRFLFAGGTHIHIHSNTSEKWKGTHQPAAAGLPKSLRQVVRHPNVFTCCRHIAESKPESRCRTVA